MDALKMSAAAHDRPVSSAAGGRRRTSTGAAILRAIGLAKSPDVALEAMERQAETLNARLATATTQADEARAHRRNAYLADPIDEVALADAEEMERVATSRLAALQDALVTLVDRIEAARAGLAAETDVAERERIAADVEGRAEKIAKAATALDKVAESYSAARETMVDVVVKEMLLLPDPIGMTQFERPEVAMVAGGAELAAGGLASAYGAAHRFVEGLRKVAADIRAGALPATMPPAHYNPVTPAPKNPEIGITLWRPAFYRTSLGQRVELMLGGIMVPEPIAAEAKRQGIGFDMDTDEAKQILRIIAGNPAARIERSGSTFRAVKFTGLLNEGKDGKASGIPPAPPPADLGTLPAA